MAIHLFFNKVGQRNTRKARNCTCPLGLSQYRPFRAGFFLLFSYPMQKNFGTNAALIFNPASGAGKSANHLETLKKIFNKNLLIVQSEPGKIKERVLSLCMEDFNRIIVMGGDGTVMGVVNGIMASGKSPVLGIIPTGTGNDLARVLGYYHRFREDPFRYFSDLAEDLENPGDRKCNVLSINKKLYFTNYLGIGLDGKIINEFDKQRTLPLPNRVIYAFCILKNLFYRVNKKVQLSVQTERDMLNIFFNKWANILIVNIPSYGGALVSIEDVVPHEKTFKLYVIKGIRDIIKLLKRKKRKPLIANRLIEREEEGEYKAQEVKITCPPGLHFQVDGEDYTGIFCHEKEITVEAAGWLRIFK